MAIKVEEEEKSGGAPDWLVTFADLMSLLLTFFVLLLSFSNIEVEKFKTLSGSIRSAFGLRSEFDLSDKATGSTVLAKPAPAYTMKKPESPTGAMMVNLREALEKSELRDQGNVEVDERGVTLRLAGDAVFASGRIDLKPAALDLMDRLAEIAATSGGQVEVEGHTDDRPIRNSRFPSNWELSSGRAGAAVRYLSSKGLPAQRLKAIGYADTIPLVANSSPENRSKNRRVEFLFVTATDASTGTNGTGSEQQTDSSAEGSRP